MVPGLDSSGPAIMILILPAMSITYCSKLSGKCGRLCAAISAPRASEDSLFPFHFLLLLLLLLLLFLLFLFFGTNTNGTTRGDRDGGTTAVNRIIVREERSMKFHAPVP